MPPPAAKRAAARGPVLLALLALLLSAAPAARAERLPLRVYTNADGLGSSAVRNIVRDSRGLLWFCTRDGLSRFDGQRFTTYRLRGTTPAISNLIERRNGEYWVVSQGSGIYRFNFDTRATEDAGASPQGEAELVLDAERVTEADDLGSLREDALGRLWAVVGGRLSLVDESGGRFSFREVRLELPGEPGKPADINYVRPAPDGSLWALSRGSDVLRRTADGRVTLYRLPHHVPLGNPVSAIFIDREGLVWIGHHSGLYVLRPEPAEAVADSTSRVIPATLPAQDIGRGEARLPGRPGEATRFSPAGGLDIIVGLHQTADGRVWFTHRDSLTVYDAGRMRTFSAEHGLPSYLGAIAEDGAGNLWIASLSGAVKLVTRGLATYGKAEGLGDGTVHAVYEPADGGLHVVNGPWHVSRFDGERFVTSRPPLLASERFIWTSKVGFRDSAGRWWFLSDLKLYRFDGARRLEDLARLRPSAVYETADGFHGGAFYHMFEDSRGDLYVSVRATDSAKSGLSVMRRGEKAFRPFSAADGFPVGHAPSAFREDSAGNVWMGFYRGGGLARYDGRRFRVFGDAEGAPAGFVTDLHRDAAGRLWATSAEDGLMRIDDDAADSPRFTKYTTAQGLSSNNVRAVVSDDAGRVYAGTVRGVDRLNPATGSVRHYSMADGLADDFITVAHRDRSGALWFGTRNGLSRLVPEPGESRPAEPPVMIGGLYVAGVRQAVSELGQTEVAEMTLPHTRNNLRLDFFSLSFAAGERMRYQYMLEGADRGWGAPTESRSVNYASLAPGTYRFLVRAVNSEGVASARPASFRFTITPPVWRRWWFVALAALAGAAVVLLVLRSRRARAAERRRAEEELHRAEEERLRELERVRGRIATDLHDDIGSSLTQISILSEVLRQRVGRDDPHVLQPLSLIASSSRELVDSMSDIVWAINPHKDHLSDLVHRMRRFASDMLAGRNIRFTFDSPLAASDVHLGANLRREVFLIFKECVNNLVKHSSCREARIEFGAAAGWLDMRITDDGCGFDPARDAEGHGLASMRRRAEALDGRLTVESAPGTGTTVSLRVPVAAGTTVPLLKP